MISFAFALNAQNYTDSCVVVSDIVVSGNNVTKDAIIFRELTFGVGDTIPVSRWNEDLRISKENVQNTTLFNFVTFEQKNDETTANGVVLHINVVERWYLWLYPYIAYSDRNLNAWYEADDITRFSYGVEMKYRNFLGSEAWRLPYTELSL